ncbi:MAG TPA: ribonuclease H-like YkuK family protein [Bacillota bacterium]|nr:ribonuclease H-like YkuK family protein [Bacillota bacterium]
MFVSPTKGRMSLEDMVADILSYINYDQYAEYQLVIGSDSHNGAGTHIVTAIIIRRIGKGARYFYRHTYHEIIRSLRQKLYYETAISLEVVQTLREQLEQDGAGHLNIEIHIDAGYVGPTRELIKEIVGMVVANGLSAKVKPYSFAASSVADRHSK